MMTKWSNQLTLFVLATEFFADP